MTKEYTGPKFEVEFARAWLKYVEGGKVGVDPRTQWEHKSGGVPGWSDHPIAQHPGFAEGVLYRWKPAPKRMVTISYKTDKMALPVARTVVAPEVEAPPRGTKYWSMDVDGYTHWNESAMDGWKLKKANVFLSCEDAQAMSDWLATCRKGGQS
jgi:hypothetical protein